MNIPPVSERRAFHTKNYQAITGSSKRSRVTRSHSEKPTLYAPTSPTANVTVSQADWLLRCLIQTHQVNVQFVAAKTRVTPVGGATIPRLELLSALILSKLMDSIRAAMEPELQLGDPVCFSDSMVALFWIRGTNHEWKPFVENRVIYDPETRRTSILEALPGKGEPGRHFL